MPEKMGKIPEELQPSTDDRFPRYYMVRAVIYAGLFGVPSTAAMFFEGASNVQSEVAGAGPAEWVFAIGFLALFFATVEPFITGAPAGHIVFGNWRDGLMTWPRAIWKMIQQIKEARHA